MAHDVAAIAQAYYEGVAMRVEHIHVRDVSQRFEARLDTSAHSAGEADGLLVRFVASVAANGSGSCKRAVRSREPLSGACQQAETAPKLPAPGPVALQVCNERSC